ncbi:MAG TPA: PAS domain-containing sensor histidine kinase, partial [Geobacterales bacterium]|nr:PAS domain-containing sensor histidine kinase [Geobacterales bacterium]
MKFTIRWQLFTTFLIVVLLTSAVVYGFGSRTLERFLLDETRETLLSDARLARQLVISRTVKGDTNHQAVAEGIGRELRARVTLIAHNGRVMGDSKVGRAELATLENHLQRPEIQGALTVGSGSSIRYSATLQTRMMYVALPLVADSGKEGFIRLALPLSTIEKSMAHLRALLGIAVATALALAILVSALLSNVTSRRIRQMTTAAAHIGGGNYDARLPV